MKKLTCIVLCAMLLLSAMVGCSAPSPLTGNANLHIVTTIFPEYDWMRQILGEQAQTVDLTLLIDNGMELHSYQPSAEDIINISTCDLFVYTGGQSSAWVDAALNEAVNKDMVVINLMDVLGDAVKEETLVNIAEHAHDHEDHEHDETCVLDEHVWLSLKNAKAMVAHIAQQLGGIDPDHADAYTQNAEAYIGKLDTLDAEYSATVENAEQKTLLFADRFPFRYLMDDYGIDYYAAFPGCSTESDASFETIAFLAGKLDELKLKSVLTIEGTEQNIAQAIIQNTADKDQTVLSLDSMQSVDADDIAQGLSYLGVMESNLQVLKDALN